jgi:hypothetical protein
LTCGTTSSKTGFTKGAWGIGTADGEGEGDREGDGDGDGAGISNRPHTE